MLAGPKNHRRLREDILVSAFLQPGIERRGHGSAYIRGRCFLAGLSLWPLVLHDLHDLVTVRNALIDRKLVDGPNADDHGNRHAGGQPEDIDKGVATILAQLAEGEVKIVFEHALALKIHRSIARKVLIFLHLISQPVAIQ